MTTTTSYRAGLALALGTAAFLVLATGALGIVGIEGDRADLLYVGGLAIGLVGAIVARFRPAGMARALAVTAAAMIGAGLIALVLGKHEAPYSSVPEIMGLSTMFATLFGASAWLFWHCDR